MDFHRLEYESADLQSFGQVVGGVLQPFVLDTAGGRHRSARLIHRRSSRLQLSDIVWNNPVAVNAGRLERCHLIQIPIAGGFRDLGTGRSFTDGQVQFVMASEQVGLEIEDGCRLLILRIDEASLQSVDPWRENSGAGLDVSTATGATILRLLRYFAEELDADPGNDGPILSGLENLLLQTLSDSLGAAEAKSKRVWAAPYYVKQAKTFISSNLQSELQLKDIAAYAGVSPRTLQYGFRRSLGLSPFAYWTAMRLDRAHDDLAASDVRSTRVTEIAMKWRFFELGRFAKQFRQRFGENPLDTLKSHR